MHKQGKLLTVWKDISIIQVFLLNRILLRYPLELFALWGGGDDTRSSLQKLFRWEKQT